jgi:hypothetical protein
MSKTPTARTLEALRDAGREPYRVVEHWNAFAKVRVDLFGFIDILVCDVARSKIVGIQVTDGSNVAKRRTKILTECRDDALAWLRCDAEIELWGWRELKKTGWTARVEQITISDFDAL